MITLPNRLLAPLSKLDPLLPLLARLTFAATLAGYFWASALTKLGPSPWQPSTGAYAQILPRLFERVGYDASQLSLPQHLLVISGTWVEFLLPALLLIGLHTRAAALGMIGFIFVQNLTDLFGHGALSQPETLGAWFDRAPDSLILDQRAFWLLLLSILVIKAAGAASVDAWLTRRLP